MSDNDASQCRDISVLRKDSNQENGCVGLRITLPKSIPHEHPVQDFLNASPWFHRIYRGNGDVEGRINRLKLSLGARTSSVSD